jgi:hypothetical protein
VRGALLTFPYTSSLCDAHLSTGTVFPSAVYMYKFANSFYHLCFVFVTTGLLPKAVVLNVSGTCGSKNPQPLLMGRLFFK